MAILKTDHRIIRRGGGRAVSYAGMEGRGGREEGTESRNRSRRINLAKVETSSSEADGWLIYNSFK